MNDTDPCVHGALKDISDIQKRISKWQMTVDAMSVTLAGLEEFAKNQRADGTASPPKSRQGTATVSGQTLADEQLKRLLALIENNAQANALARDTTNNILVRLDAIERKMRRGRTSGSRSPQHQLKHLQSELPPGSSRMVTSNDSEENRTGSPNL